MRGARIFSAISAATGVIVLALAASASAATVTYRNDTTQFNPLTSSPGVSTITVPGGRTPVAKIELPGVRLSANSPDGSDAVLALTGPQGTTPPFDLVSGACNLYSPNAPIDFTDSATNTVGTPNCSGGLKPEDARTLALFNGGPSSGTWTATITDSNSGNGLTFAFLGWGLRITHAPFIFTVRVPKQGLHKKVRLSASCNAKCTITSSGDVKARRLVQAQNVNSKFKLPLKGRAFNRLDEEGGKAKFTLVADDGYGDLFTQKVKIRFRG